MKKQIAPDEPLDYIQFRISPDDRYYVIICSGKREEKIGSLLVGQVIMAHLAEDLYIESEGSYANFKLELPENLNDTNWFTKSTLTRFLQITDSPDTLKIIFAISNEMSQLEESRKFHLSLYGQGHPYGYSSMNDKAENSNSNRVVQTPKEENVSSDNSKNELLRAMDLRLTALGDELVTAFNQAAGAPCSPEEILNLKRFCRHFGAAELCNLLSKLLRMNLKATVNDPPNNKFPAERDSTVDNVNKMTDNGKISKPSNVDQPVIYGASPEKAARIERQSSTEGEDSSFSSEEDRPVVERSRNLTRSATPRRSASPMRRIQIGRSGSRRTPAIAIKSLGYFPARDKTFSSMDATSNDCETDESEQPNRAAESNCMRISVQDAISLFERKQRHQATDAQKLRSQADNPANVSKSALRRWSSGEGEKSTQCLDQNASDPIATSKNLLDQAPSKNSAELQLTTDILPCPPESETAAEVCIELETSKQNSHSPDHPDIPVTNKEGAGETLDVAEWNRQKEAELNQMLMSFVPSMPSKYQSTQADDSKTLDSSTRLNKERKNQKFQRENTGKRTDKQAQSRTTHKALDKAKPEISPRNISNVGKKQPGSKTQKEKVMKSMPLSSNSKKESLRPAIQKAPSKPSRLPATRKSWPLSTTAPKRTTGTSSANTLMETPTSGSVVPRQKPQSPASLSRLSPKLETTKQQKKDVRVTQGDSKKSSRSKDDSKRQLVPKSLKTTKTKGVVASVDNSSTVPANKPCLLCKVAKKSSVVPLESKPSSRKGSGVGLEKTTAINKKVQASPLKEPLSKPEVVTENTVRIQEIEVAAIVAHPVTEYGVGDSTVQEVVHHADLERESHASTPPTVDEKETSNEAPTKFDDNIERVTESSTEIQPEDEPSISPMAWMENDHQDLPQVTDESTSRLASPAKLAAASSGSQVQHSLSQMLLEESSEPDIIEWGNVENPPTMVYQKDAPKGLKRLLKFARKSRGEANVGGCSSPYTSEGEDDGVESKGFGKKNGDNLLKKAAVSATQHGHHGISSDGHERILADSEPLSARSNASNSSFHSSTSATSRASRSFFSLSAFRGNKATETKTR